VDNFIGGDMENRPISVLLARFKADLPLTIDEYLLLENYLDKRIKNQNRFGIIFSFIGVLFVFSAIFFLFLTN